MILLTVLSSAVSTVNVSFAIATKDFIDSALALAQGGGLTVDALLSSGAFLAGLILLSLILQAALSRINARASFRLDIRIKQLFFNSLLKKDYSKISEYHSGELMNRLTSDISVVTGGIISIIPDSFSTIVRIVVSFIYLFMLDPVLSIAIVSAGPFILLFGRLYGKRMKRLHKDVQRSDGVTRSFMQEMLQNIIVVKSFDNEDRASKKAADYQNINYKYKIKRNTLSIIANIGLFVIFIGGFFAALTLGVYKLANGIITIGTFNAIIQLVNQLQAPFMNMSGIISQFYSTIASSERLIEVEDIKTESRAERQNNYDGAARLVISNVSFSYPAVQVIDNMSLEISKGEFVALTGPSGIGKSTLLKLLLAIVTPETGEIYIQNSDGSKTAINENTRDYFSYVPQGNMIVAGSIADNIKFFNDSVSGEFVQKCAETAQMGAFLSELPDGLNTILKEGGEGLSQGQIQRIAIARALAYDRPALLLDEATSALDEQTEINLLQSIRALNKSCIVVSHRKAAVEMCDRECLF